MTESPTPQPADGRARNWIIGLLAAGGLAALLVGGAILTTPHAADARWFGHRGGHGHGDWSERASFAVEWTLRKVDASDAQREEVAAIVTQLVQDLSALRGDHGELHGAFVAELTAERVDREALEGLRQQQLAALDTASQRVADALVEIGSVLTPEQRQQLAELAQHRRGHHP